MIPPMLDLARLKALYAAKPDAILDVFAAVSTRMEQGDPAAFITRRGADELLAEARALLAHAPDPASLPLWGIPFAVKDNIDVAGLPTTAACPAFAYNPAMDATVIAKLKAAGAIVIGKTNLDQFATGLNGTRSPYGAPRSVFHQEYVSGGSSSGSAVAVASGMASFALGTDTAGSGRVPAAFNNLVGIKPSNGLLSSHGSVAACKSVDCITVFAACVADGLAIRRIAEGFDAQDCYSKSIMAKGLPPHLRVGILAENEREFFGDEASAALYQAAIDRAQALGATIIPFDYAPFRKIAALLYDGPWVAERYAAIDTFIARHADAMDPTVRAIIQGAQTRDAVDAFKGQYTLATLKRETDANLAKVDVLMLPTSPTIHKVEDMLADPVRLNSQFGRYTNFANFLGMAAIAVPAGFRPDGLPFGITLLGETGTDEALAPFADAMHRSVATGAGLERSFIPSPLPKLQANNRIEIAVVGAHLSGMPLNPQLTTPGGWLVRVTKTAAEYRFFALPDTVPPKPGLIREPGFAGPGIVVEIWSLPAEAFGQFVAAIPAPLGIGKLTLEDGTAVSGFLCEASALTGATDISAFGGWRAYRASL